MKRIYSLTLLAALALPMAAQPYNVDRKKYTDFTPVTRVDASLLRYGATPSVKGLRPAPVAQRPDHFNNASTKYFPPVFNQSGGSCGSASRIAYMFTHELNSFRGVDGSTLDHCYPTHFVWLLTSGGSGKDQMVSRVGVPSAATYGGRTFSSLFGYQEETQNDFGWMTGYDKWFEAMHNRMLWPARLPGGSLNTPESREIAKNWLWNHNGDPDFHAGGLLGIGVASAVTQGQIPNTDANQAAGVVGQKYVASWGKQVDHALTIVGYDDRIEFDLDGNGKAGENDNERGAWIIVNSWGLWANNGFIYCPYAYSGPVGTGNGGWTPEIYRVRKNYRPLRTLKVRMDYSHRSEILLKVGVSTDLNAKQPEEEIELEHFRFAGDGKNGDAKPAPAIPMLGKWADGKLHDEPMEFGYDLTDLTSKLDVSRPLKFFFTINARTKSGSGAIGKGHVYHAGVIDYEFDQKGVETPFDLGTNKVVDVPGGKETVITTVVYGEQYGMPQNLTLDNGKLAWMAPQAGGHEVKTYKVFRNGELLGETTERTFAATESGVYGVAAVYETGVVSKTVTVASAVVAQTPNVAINLKKNGFSIPDIFSKKFSSATIEFWIRPNSLTSWNQATGPGWGQFMSHSDASGSYTAGWDTNHRVTTDGGSLQVGKWSHIAMVVNNGVLRLHVNGGVAKTASGGTEYKGIGGFGDLVFSASNSNNNYNDATYDEIRIWDNARVAYSLNATKNVEFSGDVMPQGLIAYYKGDIITIDGRPYLRDCVGGHHAPLANTDASTYEQVNSDKKFATEVNSTLSSANTKIVGADKLVAGMPTEFTAYYPDVATQLTWDAPEAGVTQFKGDRVTLTYPRPGTYNITLKAANATGSKNISVTKAVTVAAGVAPVADFAVSAAEVAAGERVTFTPTTPQPGYFYEWSMPGGDVAVSKAITASTAYDTFGTYNVTLTVTAPDGQKATASHKVKVTEVAPVADFNIPEGVLLKGEKGSLRDASKFAPTQWQWILSSPAKSYLVNGKQCNISIDAPGVYDAVLTVKNGVGTSIKRQSRGLVVTNADSRNGLNFSGGASRVVADHSPIKQGDKEATIEWWMNPAKLSDFSCGLGDADATFQIKVSSTGKLIVHRHNTKVETGAEIVVAGEWHHYAVTFRNGQVSIYRDGLLLRRMNITSTTFPAMSQFAIGTGSAEMSGQIDELRVWGTALSEEKLREYANAPIADVRAAEQGADKLLLYYDFNQTGGDVTDRTTAGNNGHRTGFGPDGDAWSLSKGVFCLNFDSQVQDVTKDHLSNFKKPFAYNNAKQVNNTQSNRWYAIKDWTLENSVTTENGKIITGVHVDRQKNTCFTFTAGWDKFSTLTDHKCYQVVTLPAGVYNLSTTFDEGFNDSNASGSHLVVAAGKTLPNTAELNGALASARMENIGANAVNTLTFVLPEQTEVALGLVINMGGQTIASIKEFKLTRSDLDVLSAIDAVVTPAQVGSEQLYDLSGRRVVTPESGQIYIQGGKRILVK